MADGLAPLAIINDVLLAGMKVVGELFATGEMQLPFVLQSAETMKAAVAYLEPHMEKADVDGGKGRIVLATVKGDVHDIGKNLVDIILTNNGYEVVNLGIKISIAEMIEKAAEVKADAIGMSGLLVKSTLDHAREPRGAERPRPRRRSRCCSAGPPSPAATSSATCARSTTGRLFYGKDAVRGPAGHGPPRRDPARRRRRRRLGPGGQREPGARPAAAPPPGGDGTGRADAGPLPEVAADNAVFDAAVPRRQGGQGHPPRRHRRLPQRDRPVPQPVAVPARDHRRRQHRDRRGVQGPHPADPARRSWPRPRPPTCSCPQVVYGYFPANADGDDLVIWTDESRTAEQARFHYPRQQKAPYLCIADFFRPIDSGEVDYAAFHIVTMGQRVSDVTAELFAEDQLPGVPAGARPRGRDGRGARRVLAPPHPRGVGLRRRGRPVAQPACSASSTAAAATRGATRRARTSRTTRPSPSCSTPAASASR